MSKIIKLLLASLFFICLLDMPYGFYQFVRFTALVGFAFLAYQAYQREKQTEMVIYILLALLFQPVFKISLGRPFWNAVDVIVGIALIASIFLESKKQSSYRSIK